MTINSGSLEKQIAIIKKAFTDGHKDQALSTCQNLVFQYPSNAALRKLLANLLAIDGKHLDAAKQLSIGFEFHPNDEELLFNLGICYLRGLAYSEAVHFLTLYVDKYPSHVEGWGSLAECQLQLKQFSQAMDSCSKAMSLSIQESRPFYIRSKIYRALKQYDEALSDLDMAIQMQDKNISYLFECAEITLLHQGRLAAKPYFIKVTQLKPSDYLELLYLGKAYYELGNINQSIIIFQQIISANQHLEYAYLYLGSAHHVLRQYPEALACYEQVVRLNKNSFVANINIANTLQAQNLFKESVSFINKALEIDPSSAFAYKLRAQSYVGDGFEEEILNDLLLAEKLNPSLESLQGHLLYSKLNICDWSDLSSRIEQIKLGIKHSKVHVLPFQATLFFDDPELHQLCAQQFIASNFPIDRHKSPEFTRVKKEKLKIAYLSPDFGQHPVAYLTSELFELHDRNQFEIFAVSLTSRPDDPYRLRIKNGVDSWFDISKLTDSQAIEFLRNQNFDIAIDLCGHTRDFRLSLWANRIAPIQISYLGYLGTMGCAHYFDYLIADEILIPKDLRVFYDEKIIYLPNYQINDRKRPHNEISISRSSLGILENHFVFACLNNSFKYQPEIFNAWMRILSIVPDSSLVLFAKFPKVIKNLRTMAKEAKVNPDRLIFLDSSQYEIYLSRLKCVDLFLDTTIYNAGTTASDALWMGVPVITCIGRSFSARMAASVLSGAGMSCLITHSLHEYIKLATELALDSSKYLIFKNQLISNSLTCKLFDSYATTRSLEKAYQLIWDNYLSGALPKDFLIQNL